MKPRDESDWCKLCAEVIAKAEQDIQVRIESLRIWDSTLKPLCRKLKKAGFNIEIICQHVAWKAFVTMRENRKN